MSYITRAKDFALKVHTGQTHGGRDYSGHLGEVVAVLYRFQVANEPRVMTAWLHDTVEDCDAVTLDHIASKFGQYVRELVDAVTDVTTQELVDAGVDHPNRAARKQATYNKTRRYSDAIIVKLADRIANVEFCWTGETEHMGLYRKEHAAFREALYGNPKHTTYLSIKMVRVRAMEYYLDHLLAGWQVV